MKYDIRNRYTNNVQFTAEIECAEDTSESVKRGLAVCWAVANKINLIGADLSGAYLSEANLSKANLDGANLSGANLSGANLSGAYLFGAYLSRAYLDGAYLSEANLSGAYLSGAYLIGADLSGAYLSEANLRGADLSKAVGIISFGPIGQERRIGYAAKHDVGPMIRLGCFWGTLDEACAAIRAKYGENSTYENLVRAACAALD